MKTFLETPWPSVVLCTLLILGFGVLFMRTGSVVGHCRAGGLGGADGGSGRAGTNHRHRHRRGRRHAARHRRASGGERHADGPGLVFAELSRHSQAESVLRRVTVQTAVVGRDLEVTINKLTSPPTATAYFTGRIQARDNGGTIPYENYIRKFKVRLERHGDRWLVADYEDGDLRKKMQ